MAHPSPSPPGARRLSELLDEMQEPFSLDVHLLEKGCSSALVDAAAAAGGRAAGFCSTCWPGHAGSPSRALRWPAATKKGFTASGVLRLLLFRVLRRGNGTAAKERVVMLRSAGAPGSCGVDGNKKRQRRRSSHAKKDASSSPRPHAIDAGAEAAEEDEDESGSGDSEKQLSPVSVLDQRPFATSPPAHAQKAMVVFREFRQAASTPTLLDLLAVAKVQSRSNSSKFDAPTTTAAPLPPPARKKKSRAHCAAVEEEDTFQEELATVTRAVASEMAGASGRLSPEEVRQERRSIGDDIAAAVLDALAEETAAVLMGTAGRGRCG